MTFFHFHDTSMTSAMRQFARQEETRFLRSDGSNLAGYLLGLAQGQDEASQASWARINGLVRRVAPFIDHLEPTLVAPHLGPQSAVRLDWVDDRGYFFGAHHLSDGTLRAIALITALAQPVEKLPAFISIDEPELGLHPAALGLLAGLVQSVAPHCQVLLATQSPTLLDYFDVADVVVAERKDGATQLTRLDETKLAGVARGLLAVGGLGQEPVRRAAVIWLTVLVEGDTEEAFVKAVLGRTLKRAQCTRPRSSTRPAAALPGGDTRAVDSSGPACTSSSASCCGTRAPSSG
jgi:hypothetical protein